MHTMTNEEMIKNYMWCIGNIVADSALNADAVLMNTNIMQELITTTLHQSPTVRSETAIAVLVCLYTATPKNILKQLHLSGSILENTF